MSISKRPDASAEMLAKIIQTDPAVTAKILKVVNSPLFGVPRGVASIKQAIAMIGQRPVTVMVLSFSLVDGIKADASGGFDYQAYWRRSLSAAVLSRRFGKIVEPSLAEECFVAGLLADLGMIAAARAVPDLYAEVLKRAAGKPILEAEREVLGVTHAQITERFLTDWGLPESICRAIGAHHDDDLSRLNGPAARIGAVLNSAALIAGVFCYDLPSERLDGIRALVRSRLGIDAETLENVLNGLDPDVRAAASLLSVNVGETVNYAQLQAEALMQLANLSVAAETDRAQTARAAADARIEADRFKQAAATDGLTRIANRAAFDARLAEVLAQPAGAALIMIDVDHFKKFNDTHGHQAGDEVLRAVADTLRHTADDKGFVARYGGEEFGVIVPGAALDAARDLAERLRAAIHACPIKHGGRCLAVTASLGVARSGPGAAAPADLIRAADARLYDAKRNGRNRVEPAAARVAA
ncbi:MAG: GGDEF domain-containing protein [Phycisphaerae bacterium]|nr:GGDEF domain-containing protein [Phycisphaerae bacterium]